MAEIPENMYLDYIKKTALALRAADQPPATLDEWTRRRGQLRRKLGESLGEFPVDKAPLKARTVGELKRDGYRLEKIVFQTWPGLTMTANAYVPDGQGPFPAVLCVHGHWRPAKQEPRVQARSIGLAKLGFFVLAVDAFGAGERGLEKALGEYHGEMVASTLWPSGQSLAGIQVYENIRSVDYLQSRSEVIDDQIGITGTSGGGNQTMYAGAYEERFGCVVPVCSVGTYQAYLGAACCMCEMVPSAMTYTEEWGVLGLVAPRGLMVINATRDAFQFSVGEAKKSIAQTSKVFQLYDKPSHVRHVVIDSGHDYNQPMREAMYGWMTLHLKGEGNGDPITEPELTTEDPELIRCYPGDSRPDDFVTVPQFAASRARAITLTNGPPLHKMHWEAERLWRGDGFEQLFHTSLGTATGSRELSVTDQPGEFLLETEAGITLPVRSQQEARRVRQRVILLDLDAGAAAAESELAKKLVDAGIQVITIDLRATGVTAPPGDAISRTLDHNSAQWGLWIGQPLLVQWIRDLRSLLDALGGEKIETSVVGNGAAGVVAVCAAIADSRVSRVAALESPLSLVSDAPYTKGRVGILIPGMLHRIGDIAQLLALCAPRPLLVAGGAAGNGEKLKPAELERLLDYTQEAYKIAAGPGKLSIEQASSSTNVTSWLTRKG
jgi:dienelactone hydrolase